MKQLKNIFSRLTMGRALMLGVALAGLYYYLMFDPGTVQLNAITQANAHTEETKKQIENNQKALDRAEVFKKTAGEVGTTIRKLLSSIPQKFSMPDLERIVSNEAKVAGSSLSSINPKDSKISESAKEFEELSLTIELQGTFLQHMVLLANLTRYPQILIVRRFDFGVVKEGRGDEPTQVKLSADIVAYRYRGQDKPDPAAAAAGGTPPAGGTPAPAPAPAPGAAGEAH